MKNFILILILLLTVSVSAKTVRVSDYATPDDNLDDSAGFQAAVEVLKANKGGTLEIGGGVWNINSQVNFTTYGNNASYILKGDGGSIIKLNLGQYGTAFYVGNANNFVMEDLTITGTGFTTPNFDSGIVLVSSYTVKTVIRNVQFYGIKAGMIIYSGFTDTLIENCEFGGNSTSAGNIYGAFDTFGLTVKNSTFTDYASLSGDFYSKTPQGNGSWITVERSDLGTADYRGAFVRLQDLRLDEGAISAISIKNVPNVVISGLQNNVSGTSAGAGVVLDNVKYSSISDSSFGYTRNARPSLVLKNDTKATVSRLRFGGGVFFAQIDSTSAANTVDCDECRQPGQGGGDGDRR